VVLATQEEECKEHTWQTFAVIENADIEYRRQKKPVMKLSCMSFHTATTGDGF